MDGSVSRVVDGGSKSGIILDAKDQKTQSELISEIFRKQLSTEAVEIKVEAFKSESVPALLVVDEEKRRMKEFLKMGFLQGDLSGLGGLGDHKPTLLINERSPAIKNILSLSKAFHKDEELKLSVHQVYDLARLQHEGLSPEEMSGFLERSASLIARLGHAEVRVD